MVKQIDLNGENDSILTEKSVKRKTNSKANNVNKRTKSVTKTSKRKLSQVEEKLDIPIDETNGNLLTNGHDVSSDDDDGDDWEEVEDADIVDLDSYKPDIPKNLTISIDKPKKVRKKEEWIETCIRQRINRALKDIQINIHKSHLLILSYRLLFLNSIANDNTLKALAISVLDFKQNSKETLRNFLKRFTDWFNNHLFEIKLSDKNQCIVKQEIIDSFESKTINSNLVLNIIILSFLRHLGHYVRLCYFLNPISTKPDDLLSKRTNSTTVSKKSTSKTKVDEGSVKKKVSDSVPINEDDLYWIELFDEKNKRWFPIDFFNDIYDDNQAIVTKIPLEISYIIAVDNDDYINEVTPRYATDWVSHAMKKRRIDDDWWNETMKILGRPNFSKFDDADKKEFDEILSRVELPKRVSDYKNHPLFVLKKDLLKFQAIYPANAPPLGFFHDEPVYSRECVYTLRSRETWLREARTVKPNETAYKVVTSKFKLSKNAKTIGEKEMLDLFGEWQTKPFEPPVAKDGIVPRNAYGNVELFQLCMIPKGTVHLRLPGLARVAAKLNIDCVPAVVGFDNNKHGRGSHPVMDGFIVCQEHETILIDAWREQQKIIRQREKDKKLDRIYGNWKRLIKGLIIKQNLKIKYG